jgi:hypothetical protein
MVVKDEAFSDDPIGSKLVGPKELREENER